ncbi:endonuclease domain-containing protein [Spirosoma panaciterrae]|uniref:endonuclease domain-containing protein n=1 Tax=Spirosoma panaciterrae TaxID=496058 RepID=UPI000370BC2A|nr:endonuclease domain-containing protein [Spirosoma panaciterrae]
MEEFRRELRKSPTSSETLLWERLRGSQLEGRKFRRQHSIGAYILDFYCPAERLAIEVDGSIHNTPENIINDQERDRTLAHLRITTLRISNEEIETDVESVLIKIKSYFSN